MNIEKMVNKVANNIISKKEPKGLFKITFFKIKEKRKAEMKIENEKAVKWMEGKLVKDLKSKGISVVSLVIKQGQFRGHPYITTALLKVKITEDKIHKLLGHLIEEYSPKFKFKKFKEGVAEYNIR